MRQHGKFVRAMLDDNAISYKAVRVHRSGRVVAHAVNRFDNNPVRGREEFAAKTKVILVLHSIATMGPALLIHAKQIESELLRRDVVVLIQRLGVAAPKDEPAPFERQRKFG